MTNRTRDARRRACAPIAAGYDKHGTDRPQYPWVQVSVTLAAFIPAVVLASYLADRWWHPRWGHNDPRELLTLPVLAVLAVPAVAIASFALRLRTKRSR